MNGSFLQYALGVLRREGASVHILFSFEYVILASSVLSIGVKYLLFIVDSLAEGRWEGKVREWCVCACFVWAISHNVQQPTIHNNTYNVHALCIPYTPSPHTFHPPTPTHHTTGCLRVLPRPRHHHAPPHRLPPLLLHRPQQLWPATSPDPGPVLDL